MPKTKGDPLRGKGYGSDRPTSGRVVEPTFKKVCPSVM
jgi:hypothetical protein